MSLWKWKAIDQKGITHQGLWEEQDDQVILSSLAHKRLYPVSIKRLFFRSLLLGRGYNHKLYWARTARKIGTLLEAGIPLLTITDIMAAKEACPYRQNQWQKVSDSIQAGKDLSRSLREFNPPPGNFLEAMVQAGERSGTLDSCLLETAGQMEEEYFFDKKIKATLFYPMLLLGIALTVVYVLSRFVLPMYEELFSGLHAELPMLTRILFEVGTVMPYFIVGSATLGMVMIFLRKGKVISLPGTGNILRFRALMQFSTVLYRLLESGLPLLQCVNLMEEITQNEQLNKIIVRLKYTVQEGKRISPVFRTNGYFPIEAAMMLEVAEESGRLDEMLKYSATYFRKELEEQLAMYSRVLEPVLVLGMAGMVAIVALGVLLPIFNLSTHI